MTETDNWPIYTRIKEIKMIAMSYPPYTSDKFNWEMIRNREASYSTKSVDELLELIKDFGKDGDVARVQFQEGLTIYEYELNRKGSDWVIYNKMKRVITWEPVPFDAQ